MTPAQIGKIWTVMSLVLLYYAFNSWIVTQGGHEVFSVNLISSDRIPAAMIAIPICTILLTATSIVGRTYAMRMGPQWHDRIPVVGFEGIDTASPEGRIYQGAMAFLFTVVPAVAMVHFWICSAGLPSSRPNTRRVWSTACGTGPPSHPGTILPEFAAGTASRRLPRAPAMPRCFQAWSLQSLRL